LIRSTTQTQYTTLETELGRDYSYEFLTFASKALSKSTNSLELLIAYNDGWSIKECAARFGEKEGTLKSRLYYARRTLRQQGEELISHSTADFSLPKTDDEK
jgi:hypothetical protein